MQYIEHISAAGVVTHVPVSSCTFKITEAAVQVTGGNSGAKTNSTRKVTHFSPLASGGVPTIPAAVLATGVQARLGFFNKNGHFNPMTEISVGPA
jgi:hypothetical protein